jgi:DNA-binding SARP family transcriptional activator
LPQAEIQIHVFGEGALQLYKQRVMDWHRSPHNKMLLTILARHPRGVTTEEIRTFLWPDAPNPAAIHTAVKKLRDLIGGARIVNQNGIYMLNGDTWLDAMEYELLYVRARQKPLAERLDD